MTKINGGATIWARQTIDSDIFYNRPDKWFKIWFFIVNRVNHKDNRKWKRGQGFMTYNDIIEKTSASRDQVDKCLRFLKQANMIATQKATRGMHITVLKYNIYQDFENYRSDTESDSRSETEAKQKRNRSDTKNNNDNNDNNDNNVYGEFQNVHLTEEEYTKLCEALNQNAVDTLIEELSGYIASTGKRYKSHYATLQNWARRRIKEHITSQKPNIVKEII